MASKAGKIIGGIVLAPFVLIALGVAYCEANKAYWNHQVKLMCEKDGGVTVFEKVELTKDKDDAGGSSAIQNPDLNNAHYYAWTLAASV